MENEYIIVPNPKKGGINRSLKRRKLKEQKPEAKVWWQNPFWKGFMYTLGVLSALFIVSLINNFVIETICPGFDWFQLLEPPNNEQVLGESSL